MSVDETTEGCVTDANGNLIAYGATSCMVSQLEPSTDVNVSPPAAAPHTTFDEFHAFDVFDPEHWPNPYPRYAMARKARPLIRTPLGVHLVTRYQDCATILQDNNWSHAHKAELFHPGVEHVDLPTSFLWMDPPDHTRLRALVSKAFTPRTVANLRPRIEQLVKDLFDAIIEAREVDVISALAYPLPLTIIAELLGAPAEDHPDLQRWSRALARGFDPEPLLSPGNVTHAPMPPVSSWPTSADWAPGNGVSGTRRAGKHALSVVNPVSTRRRLVTAGVEETDDWSGWLRERRHDDIPLSQRENPHERAVRSTTNTAGRTSGRKGGPRSRRTEPGCRYRSACSCSRCRSCCRRCRTTPTSRAEQQIGVGATRR
ncbi:hypothetical protein [Parafrankia sp. EAN1pec]|uniref:hypothetical protein n=1 Tax=Parafrankia sp. (strain EAN1pec) TaxID=298653 RepID=UPI00321946C7